jgi:hypothetical protein
MKLASRILASLATFTLLVGLAPWGFAQATYQPNAGKYGITAWAINNQRNASAFNYYIDSVWGSGLGAYSFPPSTIYQAVPKGSQGFAGGSAGGPFNTNATVKIIDINSSLTETVAFNSNSCTTGAGVASVCTLSLANSNSHTSYVLRSGTCGLREALNDLGTAGGTVLVDQQFYDDGCTASTITTAATLGGTLQANQYIYDISNGQDVWYSLQPSTLTALAVPVASNNLTCTAVAGLVCQSATTGGTWPNSAEVAGSIYVDALGAWSAASLTHTLTPSASGTNVLQFNSPAASAGAAGWLPWGGLTYNSAAYVLPVDSVNVKCTLSTQFTAYPVCAIGATATVLGPVVTTSLIPQAGGIAAAYNPNPQSHNAFAYRPSQRPGYEFQQNYGPFTATPALTAGQLGVLGTVQLPTGFLQSLGIFGTLRFSGDVTFTPSTTSGTIGIDTEIGDITDFSTGTPKIVCTEGETTANGTAAIKVHFDCSWTVNALGTTGSIMPGGFFLEQLQAGTTTGNLGVESATAAITADVLDQDSVYFVFLQATGAESTTPPQLLNLKIEVLNN